MRGDTDTLAAIVGRIVGANVGPDDVPSIWKTGLPEWPRSLAWIERLAEDMSQAVSSGGRKSPPRVRVSVVARNVLFIAGVGLHLARRLLPPYQDRELQSS